MANVAYNDIQVGDRVVCLVHAGIGRNGPEKKEKAGKVVMRSLHGGWVLNGGGKHGTPVVVDANNFVRASRK
jgi:hypothetical protein